MCGRYASFLPAEALARIFGTVNRLPNFEQTWNMAPTRDEHPVSAHLAHSVTRLKSAPQAARRSPSRRLPQPSVLAFTSRP
jgi:hypothetical protein